MFIDMAEGIIVARLGPEAKLTKVERDAIEPNAAKILSNLSPKTADAVNKFSEPIALVMGLFFYGMRLSAISAKKTADDARNRPAQVPAPVADTPSYAPPVTPVRPETRARTTFVPQPGSNGAAPVAAGNAPPEDRDGRPSPDLHNAWGVA